MSASPLETVLSALEAAECQYKRSGGGYQARCPAHQDCSPSLSISATEDSTVLVKCHAGCTTEAVVKALGLTMHDLFVGVATRPLRACKIRILRNVPAGDRPALDFACLAKDCKAAVDPTQLGILAGQLGLSATALRKFGIGWAQHQRAWTFPMSDADGHILGIRLRLPDGRKLCIKGSKEGLFILSPFTPQSPLVICEGPTDAAALIDMGFPSVVGRPSCTGGVKLLVDLVQRGPTDVVIVADGDEPGQRGANNLASVLAVYSPKVCVIRPPDGIKDARVWLQIGGTLQDVQAAINAAPAQCLTLQTRTVKRGK